MTFQRSRDALWSALAGVGLDALVGESEESTACACRPSIDDGTLVVDASACDGDLAHAPACRRTVVETVADREVSTLVVATEGLEYRYRDRGVDLLGAAGRFVELLGDRDAELAASATTDPLAVAAECRSRVGPVADVGVESGLVSAAEDVDSGADALTARVGLGIAHYYVDRTIDEGARLGDVRTLSTGSETRVYECPDGVPRYVLDPVGLDLSTAERATLRAGYEAIAEGDVGGDRAASRAIEGATDEPADPLLTSILEKHTDGYGVLEDLFADPRITDVYATSPVSRNPIRVVVDGESMVTNVHLTRTGARALASRVRRTSGRAFSRAKPTVDATADLANGTSVRVAGVTDPVADGVAFAFRERAEDRFTLPALVANGTLSAALAAFLSVAIERNAAALIAGTRGSGKTTLLGTLLYELPTATRTVLIEDTPELPVDAVQAVGRDVQALRTGLDDGPEISPAEALRTALRLGDGALVVGEIRGEEAPVLYEAMRVGANANAVLGTIHGDGAADVYERVVSDLGVQPSSFGVTDLVVTVQLYRTPAGRARRVARIEEVLGTGDDIRFEALYALDGEHAASTGRIDRGESRIVDRLAGPTESYADVRAAIARREATIRSLVGDGRTSPGEVADAYADRGRTAGDSSASSIDPRPGRGASGDPKTGGKPPIGGHE